VKPYRYLFGPVPSRRFGRSLGVDLTPPKTCSFDCVFCQLGRTKQKTVQRNAYVPIDAVIKELDKWLTSGGHADYITLSGSGEPTLHTEFGAVLAFLKKASKPSVLLTNGSLLWHPQVSQDAALADIVKISLSAWNQHSFEWINRPHKDISFSKLVEGQKTFRKIFTGQLWMEVFLLFGMNSRPADVSKLAAVAKTIKPDRVQLNSVARPPAEGFAAALSLNRMQALCPLFDPPAEIIANFRTPFTDSIQATEADILTMLQRRPCTIKQIASAFNMHINEVSKYLGKLIKTNAIHTERKDLEIYYSAIFNTEDKTETV
jgi:wyosine [tRNA(Phe)-imidazoG37] synthetase (radical SAM superfamily)